MAGDVVWRGFDATIYVTRLERRASGRTALGRAKMVRTAGVLVFLTSSAWAQQVVSARAGTVHHVEGEAVVAGTQLQPKEGLFYEVKEGQRLETRAGRAEVLLNPGIFLRLAPNSS